MSEAVAIMQSNASDMRSEPRYPCVGIAQVYSAIEGANVAGLGHVLHHAALAEMSLRGLSFDIEVPLIAGQSLTLLVRQPDEAADERLTSEVRWCRRVGSDHYRVGVRIVSAEPVTHDAFGSRDDLHIGVGPAMPVEVELPCPACGKQVIFHLAGQQAVGKGGDVMPLYVCNACGTTRSITGILAHVREQVMEKDNGHAGIVNTKRSTSKSASAEGSMEGKGDFNE